MAGSTALRMPGIHHITAICGDPQRNLDFYSGILGLRLVKKTVNFDDPGTYHLYYGDGLGSPGTIMTFFAWILPPTVLANARQGTGQIIATCVDDQQQHRDSHTADIPVHAQHPAEQLPHQQTDEETEG